MCFFLILKFKFFYVSIDFWLCWFGKYASRTSILSFPSFLIVRPSCKGSFARPVIRFLCNFYPHSGFIFSRQYNSNLVVCIRAIRTDQFYGRGEPTGSQRSIDENVGIRKTLRSKNQKMLRFRQSHKTDLSLSRSTAIPNNTDVNFGNATTFRQRRIVIAPFSLLRFRENIIRVSVKRISIAGSTCSCSVRDFVVKINKRT